MSDIEKLMSMASELAKNYSQLIKQIAELVGQSALLHHTEVDSQVLMDVIQQHDIKLREILEQVAG